MSGSSSTPRMPYMAEPWFALLVAACERENKSRVAERLGVSPSAVCQVLNASGNYGNGKASPAKLAERVQHKFGSYECPHLTQMFAEPRVITAAECRTHAHRETVPIGSPGALAHWRACNTCPHKPLAAPAVPKVPKPRKRAAEAAAEPATDPVIDPATTTATTPTTSPVQEPSPC